WLLTRDWLNASRLLTHTCVRENGVSSSQIFQVCLEGTDVGGGTVRHFFSDAEIVRDLLHSSESGELSPAHAHGVTRMNKAVGARHGAAVGAVRICRRPISCAVDFA